MSRSDMIAKRKGQNSLGATAGCDLYEVRPRERVTIPSARGVVKEFKKSRDLNSSCQNGLVFSTLMVFLSLVFFCYHKRQPFDAVVG